MKNRLCSHKIKSSEVGEFSNQIQTNCHLIHPDKVEENRGHVHARSSLKYPCSGEIKQAKSELQQLPTSCCRSNSVNMVKIDFCSLKIKYQRP